MATTSNKEPDERESAIQLANRLLDEPYADPDDDLRVLARQLLRRVEEVGRLTKDIESGFMEGAYARLRNLQTAENERNQAWQRIDRVLIERNHYLQQIDHYVRVLADISLCLPSPPVKLEDGREMQFVDPDPARTLKLLQDSVARARNLAASRPAPVNERPNPVAVRLNEASVVMEDTPHPELAVMLRIGAEEIARTDAELDKAIKAIASAKRGLEDSETYLKLAALGSFDDFERLHYVIGRVKETLNMSPALHKPDSAKSA